MVFSKKSKDILRKEISSYPMFKNKNFKIYLKQTEEENSKLFIDCYNILLFALSRLTGTIDEDKTQAAIEIRELMIFKFDIYKIKNLLSSSQSNYDKGRYKACLLQELRKNGLKIDEIISLLTDLQPYGGKPETPYKTFGVPLERFEDEKDLYVDTEGDDDANAPI